MKRSLLTLTLVGLSLLFVSVAFAATLTATLTPGSLTAKMTKITAQSPWDGSADVWGASGPVGNIAFGTLSEITSDTGAPLATFAPADKGYYCIDIGFSGGGGMPADPPNVTIGYSGDSVLLDRIVTTYKLMTYGAAEPTGTKQYMSTAAPAFVGQDASYQGGHWVRIYLGINTDWADGASHVFTYATPSGAYSVNMVVTIA